ncbi:hypothetical protein ACE1TH_15595 [Shouchella sp. JSM 1781072]|uniref:hypothetical protein n=1 Tax=Shouchella sp. JSM 1781072 TaxID=3344581 RepID=UPI0035C0BAD8
MGYSHMEKNWKRTIRPLSIIGAKYYYDEENNLYRRTGHRLVLVRRARKWQH